MSPRRARRASQSQGWVIRSPFTLAVVLLLAAVIIAMVLNVPPGLWSRPGFAGLRTGTMETLGLPVTQWGASTEAPAPESWYQVYFTSPGYPDRKSDHHGGIDQDLAALIDGAEQSVDAAAYELDLDTVVDALLAARERGVAVRLVTDTDNLDEEPVQRLQQGGVPVVDDRRGAIMHDKFVVIDGRRVWTGSWNLTVNGTYRNNNNAIVIDSEAVADNYAAEFAEMFEQGAFGPRSPSDTPHPQVTIEGTLVECYFAPEDEVTERLVATLSRAQRSIRFLAFSFTDPEIGRVLAERAAAGVEVSGVLEARGAGSLYSQFETLREAGIDVLLDGNPYVMHHKVLIIDEGLEDAVVVTGSFNYSRSADEDNDENILIIHSRDVAGLYLEEFERVRQQAQEASLVGAHERLDELARVATDVQAFVKTPVANH